MKLVFCIINFFFIVTIIVINSNFRLSIVYEEKSFYIVVFFTGILIAFLLNRFLKKKIESTRARRRIYIFSIIVVLLSPLYCSITNECVDFINLKKRTEIVKALSLFKQQNLEYPKDISSLNINAKHYSRLYPFEFDYVRIKDDFLISYPRDEGMMYLYSSQNDKWIITEGGDLSMLLFE